MGDECCIIGALGMLVGQFGSDPVNCRSASAAA
jgi:hypothetical protein